MNAHKLLYLNNKKIAGKMVCSIVFSKLNKIEDYWDTTAKLGAKLVDKMSNISLTPASCTCLEPIQLVTVT